MVLILQEGVIQRPLYFDYETFMTTINSIMVGKQEPIIEELYKCKSLEEWIILTGVFMVVLIVAIFKYKTLLSLVNHPISWVMQRFLMDQELNIDAESDHVTMYNTTEL